MFKKSKSRSKVKSFPFAVVLLAMTTISIGPVSPKTRVQQATRLGQTRGIGAGSFAISLELAFLGILLVFKDRELWSCVPQNRHVRHQKVSLKVSPVFCHLNRVLLTLSTLGHFSRRAVRLSWTEASLNLRSDSQALWRQPPHCPE
jgi:hypothetical protein